MRDILVLVIKNQAHSELKTESLKACKKVKKSAEKSKQKKATSENLEVAFTCLIINILSIPTRLKFYTANIVIIP